MKHGFSLVELSIVLVILGLLTGGILAGQNLIRASEIRAVTSEYQRYVAAMNTFRDKYFAMPGDMRNATDFWGALDGGDGEGSDCFTVESSSTLTCNGNGDGLTSVPAGGTGVWITGERYHAWLHLANAGLVEGNYTGRTDSTSTEAARTAGKNVPRSKLENNGWLFSHVTYFANSSNPEWFQGTAGAHMLFLLKNGENASSLNPEELWNIDTKMDDGRPGTGSVHTSKSTGTYSPGCATTDDPATAEYNFASDVDCYTVMKTE